MHARLRSDALHHAGGRRRSGAVRSPPDAALVLRLQRTIGNRATTQLLRRPTEEEVREDVERDRERIEALKQHHELRLRATAERLRPHALKTAGITTDSRVDSETPKWIQAALAESQLLRPYLRNKFPTSAVTDGRFKIHTDEDDFNQTYKSSREISEPMTKRQRAAAYGDIGGFFDRTTKTVHVRSRAKFGHALHEAMHKVAHSAFHGFWSEFINEGVTQYFTDCVLREQGLPEVTDHKYKAELDCAKRLVDTTSWQMVARAYFLNDGDLRETLMKRFKLDLDQFRRELRANKICQRL